MEIRYCAGACFVVNLFYVLQPVFMRHFYSRFLLPLCLFASLWSMGQAPVPTWVWAKNAGGARTSRTNAVAVDGSDNMIMAGYFSLSSLTPGTATLVSNGSADGWVVKYNSSGTMQWAAKIGDTGSEYANAVAADASGNIYVSGYFTSATLSIGSSTLINAGGNDIFLAKYDASGNPQWAVSYGNTGNETSTGLATDASGNVYITGYYGSGTTLTMGATILTNSGNNDWYVAQVNSSGVVQWAKRFGGTGNDYATGIKTDNSSNVVVTGYFSSSTMAVGSTTLATTGSNDCFITKLSSLGTVSWAVKFGGTSSDISNAVSIDGSGNIFTTGAFNSATVAIGTTTLTNAGTTSYQDLFVCSYSPAGAPLWAGSIGSNLNEIAYGIAADASGNIYVPLAYTSPTLAVGTSTYTNGSYSGSQDYIIAKLNGAGTALWSSSSSSNASTVWGEIPYAAAANSAGDVVFGGGTGSGFTVGTVTMNSTGGDDAFFVRYSAAGTPNWGKNIGTVQGTNGTSVWADASGNVYVCGSYNTSTMIVGASTLRNSGLSDAFLGKYDVNGNPLWMLDIGNSGNDYANAVAEDGSGNVFVAGYFASSALAIGSTTLTNAGSNDSYLAKYNAAGVPVWGMRIGGTGSDVLQSIFTDASGNVFITGYFSGTMAVGSVSLTSAGGSDIFVAEVDGTGAVLWAKKFGGTGTDIPNSICLDASGNVLIGGYFTSSSLVFGSSTLATAGGNDGFVAKLSSNGTGIWGTRVGGSGSDIILDVSASPTAAGYIAACGYFTSGTLAIGTNTFTNGGNEDGFCANFTPTGSPIWASQQAGAGYERAVSVSNTTDGDVYWCAYFGSNSVQVGASTLVNASTIYSGPTVTGLQPSDMYFIRQDDTTGTYSSNLVKVGGTSSESPTAIYMDASANLYVTGSTWSSPLMFSSTSLTFSYGSSPMILAKLTNIITLPLGLLDFEADEQGAGVLLSWITESDGNMKSYTVQRSADAQHFEDIGTISASGSPAAKKSYTMPDESPLRSLNYYRLKQLDLNGQVSYSQIRVVDFESSAKISVYPNPSTGVFFVEAPPASGLQVLDVNGHCLLSQDGGNSKSVMINATSLPAGVYSVSVKSETKTASKRIIIIK